MEFKNTRNKKQSIETLEALSEIFEDKNNDSKKSDRHLDPTKEKTSDNSSDKKNYTLSLSKEVIRELEVFLKDFGGFKESKSSFIEEAILELIECKKKNMKENLLLKIKKLEN